MTFLIALFRTLELLLFEVFLLQLAKHSFALCENLFILKIDFSLFDLRFFKFFFFVKVKENSTIEQHKCKCHEKRVCSFKIH